MRSGASARASTDLPVPERPPIATRVGGGGAMRAAASSKYVVADFSIASAIGLRCDRGAGGRHLGADRRAHGHQERQRRQRVEVLGAPGLGEIAVEHDIGRRLQASLDEVHQQEGEVVEHVAGGDERIEFEGIERHRPAVDERDIAEMQVAVSAADEAARSARQQQRPNARKRLPARGREPLDRSGGKQRGVLAEGSVVLLDIGGKRVDPRRGLDHRRAGMGRGDGAGEAVRQREIDSAMVGETIERLGLVEAVHLDRIFDGFALAPERQRAVQFARDRDDAAIQPGANGRLASISAVQASRRFSSVEKSRNGKRTARLTL